MTAAVLQTPLEVILFFTSLASHGVKPQSFQTISDLLKKDQIVRESEGFDEARLSPESLQQLYLTLLKEELKSQGKRKSASPVAQENGSPNSRKRKLSSPPLQSLSDAQEHEHLLPVLINKLYARYREQAISSVKEEEETYKELQSQLVRLNDVQANGNSVSGGSPSSLPTEARHQEQGRDGRTLGSTLSQDRQASQSVEKDTGNLPALSPGLSPGIKAAPAAPHGSPPVAGTLNQPDTIVVASNSVGRAQRSPQPPHAAELVPSPRHVGGRPSVSPGPGARSDNSQGQSLRSMGSASSASPQGLSPGKPPERSTKSPANLPPPSPPVGPPSQSAGAAKPLASPSIPAAQSPYRPSPALQSPGIPASAHGQVQAQFQPPFPRPPYPHRGYPTPEQRAAFPNQYHQPSQQSGQAIPQHLSQLGNLPQTPLAAVPAPGLPQQAVQTALANSPRTQQYVTSPLQAVQQQQQHQSIRQQGQFTPLTSTMKRHVLPQLDTSASSTKWRSTGRTREKSPEAPELSPLMSDFGVSESDSDDGARKEGRMSVDDESTRATPADAEETPSRPMAAGRGRRGRGRGGRLARGRAGSASASTRTRSRSVVSQQDEHSNATGKRGGARKVKQEPDTQAEDRPSSVPSSSAGTPLPLAGRRRANTLRSIETPPNMRPMKRKFEALDVGGSPMSTGPGTPRITQAPVKPGHVLAIKGLPRTAQTILNDVTTHKLASMFQKPISEREAPGYRELVFQPQDLKTIKSQLSAGQKAINAAMTAAQEAGQTLQNGPDAGTVWLERSADVIPPRAIVNSSQLETEICRIFANAAMFNPDPKRGVGPAFRTRARRAEVLRREKLGRHDSEDDYSEDEEDADDDEGGSLVNDAREMFQDVERQLAGWRAAERASLGDGGGGGGSSGGGQDGSKDESMAEESKDDDDAAAAATEGEDGRPPRRRRI